MPRRRRWVFCGVLLLVAGALTALSTWLHWSPCRTADRGRACLVLQEETYGLPVWSQAGHRNTFGTALVAVSAALLSIAWFCTTGWARRNPARTALAALIGLQPLVVAALVIFELAAPGRGYAILTSGWLTWLAEMLVFPLLLGAGWVLEESPVQLLRLMVLAWAVTSFGPMHRFGDFVLSTVLLPRSAVTPPGMGYVTAATQVVLGVAVVVVSLVLPSSNEPEEGDERSGRDGYTLAA
jgi:hypothetical protein